MRCFPSNLLYSLRAPGRKQTDMIYVVNREKTRLGYGHRDINEQETVTLYSHHVLSSFCNNIDMIIIIVIDNILNWIIFMTSNE